MEVWNITKAATFKSSLHLSYKNTQLLFLWTVLFNIFIRQTLSDDFWGLHKYMNCAFPLRISSVNGKLFFVRWIFRVVIYKISRFNLENNKKMGLFIYLFIYLSVKSNQQLLEAMVFRAREKIFTNRAKCSGIYTIKRLLSSTHAKFVLGITGMIKVKPNQHLHVENQQSKH